MHPFEKVNSNRMKYSVIGGSKLFLSMFILLYFGADHTVGNKDIPVCHKLWNELGNELRDWRARCFNETEEINSTSCQTEKEYFEERRKSHREMCFYEGEFPEPFLVVVSGKRIAVADLESNYSKFVTKESQNIKNLAIDPVEEKMYFMSGRIVSRANFDGSEKEMIYESGVRAFALDSVERRMYWWDDFWIYKGNMNFSEGKRIISSVSINNLAIDPYSRYLFYQVRPKEIRRYSFKTGALKDIYIKVDYRLYVDHVNKRLYYFETGGNKSDIIYSMDYNGRSLDNIKLSEKNLGAIAVFGKFLYRQKLKKAVLEEIDISTDLVSRKIPLPKPCAAVLGDIAIIEKSQHSKDIFHLNITLVNSCDSNVTVMTNSTSLTYRPIFIRVGERHQIVSVSPKNQWISIKAYNATTDDPLTIDDQEEIVVSYSINKYSHVHYVATVHTLESSKILSSEPEEFSKMLKIWLPKTGNWTICWRATSHGWEANTFHKNCDGIKPTLTLVKVVKNGKNFTFGGYATRPWGEPGAGIYRYSAAPGSFLFGFGHGKSFKAPLKDSNDVWAIRRYSGDGPTFGDGHDLYIAGNAGSNADSYTNFGYTYQAPQGYPYGAANTSSLLAGSKYFTPSEVEVLYLI